MCMFPASIDYLHNVVLSFLQIYFNCFKFIFRFAYKFCVHIHITLELFHLIWKSHRTNTSSKKKTTTTKNIYIILINTTTKCSPSFFLNAQIHQIISSYKIDLFHEQIFIFYIKHKSLNTMWSKFFNISLTCG